MNIIFSVIAIASALISAPLMAAPSHTKTIIIDKRDSCGEGRIAKFYQDRAEYDARKIKRELESAGERVKIVRLNPGIVPSNQKRLWLSPLGVDHHVNSLARRAVLSSPA